MKKILLFISIFAILSCTSKTVNDNTNAGNDAQNNTEVSSEPNTPTAPSGMPTQNVFEKLGVADFKARIAQKGENAVIIDVRTAKETAKGMLPNAIHLDYYKSDFKAQIAKLDKNKPTFLYCQSGGRSGQAMKIFKEMGFSELYDLEGGYGAWSNQ